MCKFRNSVLRASHGGRECENVQSRSVARPAAVRGGDGHGGGRGGSRVKGRGTLGDREREREGEVGRKEG